MRTRGEAGEGVKKSENFSDVINGRPLTELTTAKCEFAVLATDIRKDLTNEYGRVDITNHQNDESLPGQADELSLPHAEVLSSLVDLEVEAAADHVAYVRLEMGVLKCAPHIPVTVVPERI